MFASVINDLVSRLYPLAGAAVDASQLKALVTAALQKLDVVSREEFDAQTAVLMRTREKIDRLEQMLETIEQPLDENTVLNKP